MKKTYSKCYNVTQEADAKALNGDEVLVTFYAKSPSGKRSFISRPMKTWCIFEQAAKHIAAHHIARNRPVETLTEELMNWAKRWTPKLVVDNSEDWFGEHSNTIMRSFDRFKGRPAIPPVDATSKALGITEKMRKDYGLHALPGVERPRRVRKEEDRKRRAASEKARRFENGSLPREVSMTRTKPWEEAGYGSESTWRRAINAGVIPPDPRMRQSRNPKPKIRLVASR